MDLGEYVEHFRARVLQDALSEATADYWLGRAAAFEAVGTAECDAIAQACRNKARFIEMYPPLGIEPEVLTALREAA